MSIINSGTFARPRRRISRRRGHASQRDGGQRRLLRGFEPLEQRCLLDGALGHDAIELFDASPALFVANEGQWEDSSISYAFYGAGANVLHTDSGPVFQLFQRDPLDPVQLGENGRRADLQE